MPGLAILGLFLLSGACGLVYQVVWVRECGTLFGNTVYSASLVTAVFMVVEIGAGLIFHSMALLADGVHMATHVGALGLAAGAYWLARRHAANARFSFGSGKFGDLAAFSSARPRLYGCLCTVRPVIL